MNQNLFEIRNSEFEIMKKILEIILAWLARRTLWKYKPKIIAITGSVGKTSTKEAIFTVLKKKYRVRKSEGNLNTEIGLPLTILGAENPGRNIFGWLVVITRAVRDLVKERNYPAILVLEYGIQQPRDMDVLTSIARPDIAVLTAIGEIPVHVEYFSSPESLVAEKLKLARAVREGRTIILNADDVRLSSARESLPVPPLLFGFNADADMQITNLQLRFGKDAALGDVPDGMACKLEYNGSTVPVRLHHMFGIPQASAVAAAALVGVVLGMNLVEIADALGEYVSAPGRGRLILGIKHSFILDDTYNASPESMGAALDTLKNLPGKRKIAVLGDMLEIGGYTEEAHRMIGELVAEFVELLLVVGTRARFIADEALECGMPQERIFKFDDSRDAGHALDALIHEGDLILVKGSQGMRMEHVVLETMAHPEQAAKLLVRQESSWRKK